MDATLVMKRSALAASTLLLIMIFIYVFTGIGQESLQVFQTPVEYTLTLLRDPATLKHIIGFDNAFILFYSTCFLLLGTKLRKISQNPTVVMTSTGIIMATAVLDLIENMHFLTLIGSAQAAVTISAGEIAFQVWESMIKFHISYVGLFMLGLVLPTRTPALRLLSFSLRYIQWPVGMLIYVGPETWLKPLVFVRLSFFLTGLLIVAFTDWQKTDS